MTQDRDPSEGFTEKEAYLMVCPISMANAYGASSSPCRASRCMAWRWVRFVTVEPQLVDPHLIYALRQVEHFEINSQTALANAMKRDQQITNRTPQESEYFCKAVRDALGLTPKEDRRGCCGMVGNGTGER